MLQDLVVEFLINEEAEKIDYFEKEIHEKVKNRSIDDLRDILYKTMIHLMKP